MNRIRQTLRAYDIWFTFAGMLRGFISLNVQMLIVRPVILAGAVVVVLSLTGALFPHPTLRGIDTLLQTIGDGFSSSPAGDDVRSSLWVPLFQVFYSLLVLSGNILWLLLTFLMACGRVVGSCYDLLWMRIIK